MTYDELKKAYEMAMQKCSELESKNAEQEKKISNLKRESEDKDLRIEHLTELVLKRNKMLFGRKSEKGKYICDGQLAFEGLFNEAEAESNPAEPEPTPETLTKKSKKTGKHRGRNAIRKNLIEKPVIFDIPEEHRICDVCGKPMTEFATKYLTSRIAVIPEQIYVIKYYQKVYKCKNCEKTGIKDHIVAAENRTPVCIVPKGMAEILCRENFSLENRCIARNSTGSCAIFI